jgi:hypothetical protein
MTGFCAMKSPVAPRMSQGTIAAKRRSGVTSSSSAPATPPRRLGIANAMAQRLAPLSSPRYPQRDAIEPGQSATVDVAFAVMLGTPSAMSAGKVTSVPPPATEFIAAPTAAATATSRRNRGEVTGSCRGGAAQPARAVREG